MCFEIRKAVPRDLHAALQLDKEAFGVDARSILDYAGVFSFRGIKKFTALVGGKFAGFAAAEFDPGRKAVCLMTLAVRPEFRKKGIGTALLKRCEEAFTQTKYYLTVDCENRSAIRLYDHNGYRHTGVIHAYYLNGHDAFEMEKDTDKCRI